MARTVQVQSSDLGPLPFISRPWEGQRKEFLMHGVRPEACWPCRGRSPSELEEKLKLRKGCSPWHATQQG
jgi:hypothetical protein